MPTDSTLPEHLLPDPKLHEPYETFEGQREATVFGLWAFLASEVLLFGGLFLTYTVYRWTSGPAFNLAAEHTEWIFGTINTAILLTSSLSIAVAGRALEAGNRRAAIICIWVTIAFGLAFLVVKGFEYKGDLDENLWPGPNFALAAPAARIFWGFYWTSTALHACHVTVGLLFIGRLAWMAHRGLLERRPNSMEATSLYWHLVDAIWVVLYPCLYLVGR